MRTGATQLRDHVSIEEVYDLLHGRGYSVAMLSVWWRKLLGAALPGEEQLLQVRPGHALQPAPLLDGEEYGGLNISLGNDLRPFSKGCVEELTEPRLGILYWPCLAHGSPQFLLS